MGVPVEGGHAVHLNIDSGLAGTAGVVTRWTNTSGQSHLLFAQGNPLGGQTLPGQGPIGFDGTGELQQHAQFDPVAAFSHTLQQDLIGPDGFSLQTTGDSAAPLALDGLDTTPPVANDDNGVVANGGATVIDVLRNDSDAGAIDPATLTIVTAPERGTILGIDPVTGKISYQHDGSGLVDSFTYTVADTSGNVSDPASVSMSFGGRLSLIGMRDEFVIDRALMNAQSPAFLPISMAFLPDNRMLLLSKDGEILIVDPESGNSSSYMKLNNIDTGGERGLLDITLDPDFENNGYFYLFYTPSNPKLARIARFEHDENAGGMTSTASASSEMLVWQDTDGYKACCHYGGGLDFGPDGKLWLTTAEKFTSTTPGEGSAQPRDLPLDLASASGKIIRVNPDGSVPDGSDGWAANPYAAPNDGMNDYVWAYGLRNPFRARWDEAYGQMYIGEVGGNQQQIAHDDLHIASLTQPGAFYGWPFYEGTPNTYVNAGLSPYQPGDFPLPDSDPANAAEGDFYSAPIWSLPHNGSGASLTGGEVYRGTMFGEEWQGVYFYGDYTRDYIRYLRLDSSGTQVLGDFPLKPSTRLPGNTGEVASIAVGADGALYYAMIGQGVVRRIAAGDNDAPAILSSGVDPAAGAPPFTASFLASVVDANGDPMSYTINFGDGGSVSGAVGPEGTISVEYTYQQAGLHVASLSVSDGSVTVFAKKIEVFVGEVNDPPVITGVDSDIDTTVPGEVVTFTAMATDPENDSLSYVWHFGDGASASGTVNASGEVTATHVYLSDGSYQAFLEVTDGSSTSTSPKLPILVGEPSEVPVTNGLVLLLQSDIKIGLGAGDTVVSWLDGSGRGNNLFGQGDPRLMAGQTPTGQAAIVFDGADDLLQRVHASDPIFGLPSGSADRTMFVVVDYVDPEGVWAGVAYGDSAKDETFGLVSNPKGKLAIQGYVGGLATPVDGVTGGFMVQSAVLSANRTWHYKDGVQIDSDPKTFNTDVQKLVLGGEIAGKGEAQMKIAAVLIYDRALTDGERMQVETFLQDKYIAGGSPNAPPLAQDDPFSFIEDTSLEGNVLANDSDPDGDPLSAALVTAPAHGTLVLNPNGSFTYTPDADYDGADSFVYTASDGRGGTANATAMLTGTPVDDPARAADDSYHTPADTPFTANATDGVLANDTDPEDDPFTAALLSGPANGTLAFEPTGAFTYTPNPGFTGQDSFTYQITGGASATATVSVGEAGPNELITAGLVAAYLASENVSLGAGNVVAGWLDGSGLGNDLVALGNPLLVQGATPTGRQAIVFDGTGDLLQRVHATDNLTGLPSGSADRTMFVVIDYVDPEGVWAGVAYGDAAKNETFGLVASNKGKLAIQGYAADLGTAVDGVAGGFMVQSAVLSGNRTWHYKDGVQIDSDAKTFNTDLQKLVLGAEIAGKGEAQMQIAAVLIYNHALSEADRMSVETYLQHQFIDEGFVFA